MFYFLQDAPIRRNPPAETILIVEANTHPGTQVQKTYGSSLPVLEGRPPSSTAHAKVSERFSNSIISFGQVLRAIVVTGADAGCSAPLTRHDDTGACLLGGPPRTRRGCTIHRHECRRQGSADPHGNDRVASFPGAVQTWAESAHL
jgi:hypothetical protein